MKRSLYLLITITITSILFLVYGFFEKLVFNYKLYLGLASVALSYVLYLKSPKYFKYVFGLILLFGIFNIISFVPFSMGFGIGFLKFQLIPSFFSILYIYFNSSRILDLIQNLNNVSEEEKLNESQEKYEKFKREFKDLSNKEIENRLTYNLTPEAKKALLEIKKQREISQ